MLGDTDAALAEFRSAIDDGYRSILFERIVRLEEFEMFDASPRLPRRLGPALPANFPSRFVIQSLESSLKVSDSNCDKVR